MKCKILHETTGRLRVHLCCGRMSLSQADVLEYYLLAVDGVRSVKVYDRTQDAVVLYDAPVNHVGSCISWITPPCFPPQKHPPPQQQPPPLHGIR